MDKIILRWGDRKVAEIPLLNLLTFLYFSSHSFTNCATALGISTSLTAGIIFVFFFIVFGLYFFTHLNAIKWDGIILLLLCGLFFIVTIIIHPEYSNRFDDVYNDGRFSASSVFSLGAGIYTYYIIRMYGDNLKEVYRTFRIIAYFIFIFNIPTLIVRTNDYAMDFGYQMELAAILFMIQFLYEKRKRYPLVLSIIAILLGILYGSRASILGYLLFIFLYLIWERRATIRHLVFLGIGIVAAIIYSSQTLMFAIYNFFASLGLDSRTLYLLATGSISSDLARQDRIWPLLADLLRNSSIFEAYGAYGDRYYLPSYYPYAHSLVLEILVTFGIVLGSIILIGIVYYFFKTCKNNRSEGGVLTLAFGCFSLCRLLFSSSFWIEPYFWTFLAIMVDCSVKYRLDCRVQYRQKIIKEQNSNRNLTI